MRKTEFKKLKATAVVVVGLALGLTLGSPTVSAAALPITDSGNLATNSFSGGVVGINGFPGCINWSGALVCIAGTTHQFAVSGFSNLFSTATSATDQIKDISLPAAPTVDFMSVLGAGALAGQIIHFDLTGLPSSAVSHGNCASNAPLNTCTPANSPFTFSEDVTGTQVTIAFDALLNAYTGTSATGTTAYKARFSTNLSGTVNGLGACTGVTANIVNLLACLGSGGTFQSPWSAVASPGAPPSTPTTPASAEQCMDDSWQTLSRADGTPFTNQGDCIQYVYTGK